MESGDEKHRNSIVAQACSLLPENLPTLRPAGWLSCFQTCVSECFPRLAPPVRRNPLKCNAGAFSHRAAQNQSERKDRSGGVRCLEWIEATRKRSG